MDIFSQYQLETREQKEQIGSHSQLVDTPNGLLEFGKVGVGPAVIISHGSVGGYDQGLWLGKLLGPSFQYLAPSRFGYLRSQVPSDSSNLVQAGQYVFLLDTLKLDRAVVIGLSAGGPSALLFALNYPDRCAGLIMLSAISHRLSTIPWVYKALFFGLLKLNFLPWWLFHFNEAAVYKANGVGYTLFKQVSLDSEKLNSLRSLAATSMMPVLRRAGIINDLDQTTNMMPIPLSQIKTPTLVVHAVNDPVVPVEFGRFSANEIPGATMLEVEDGGHFCCVTHREIVVPAIQRFMQTCCTG
jgi:2-hydroxy-6-oxonona-2,4-dienedioate hydrolase